MRNYLYLLFATIIASASVSAQQTLNGDLEPNNSFSAGNYCNNININVYNAGMSNSSMTFNPGEITFIGNSSCGGPEHGNAFVALVYNAGLAIGNRMSLKLSQPLTPGKTYQFAVWIKASTSVLASGLNFGYMNDSVGNVDSTSPDTIVAPTSTTSWLRVTASFTPDRNDQFIFLEPRATATGDGLTFVDSIRILNPTGAGVEEVNANNFALQAYPNPSSGNTTISFDDHATLPCTVAVTDMLGRTVLQQTTNERKTTLNIADLPKGAYILRLTDKENNKAFIKLIAQ